MKADMTSAEFWESGHCQVMVNARDASAVAEAGIIGSWLEQQADLSGHLLFATSGSSSGRKWVALSRAAMLASARMVNRHLAADTRDCWLLALPDFHVGGMAIYARCYEAGCRVVHARGKWDPVSFHGLAASEEVTLSSLVPTQLFDLVQRGLRAPSTLRALLIGGGRLDDGLYQQAVSLGWPVMETYGMTEAASQIATSGSGSRELEILPGWEARTTPDGRLRIKGEPLLTAYVSCDGAACQLADPKTDGWFETGDLVTREADKLVIKGRADRCVKILGELVDLSKVERGLALAAEEMKLAQQEWVVVAVPDRRRGMQLVLCSDGSNHSEQLLGSYNRSCSPVERIEGLFAAAEIPRSPLGKVLYRELAKMVTGGADV